MNKQKYGAISRLPRVLSLVFLCSVLASGCQVGQPLPVFQNADGGSDLKRIAGGWLAKPPNKGVKSLSVAEHRLTLLFESSGRGEWSFATNKRYGMAPEIYSFTVDYAGGNTWVLGNVAGVRVEPHSLAKNMFLGSRYRLEDGVLWDLDHGIKFISVRDKNRLVSEGILAR